MIIKNSLRLRIFVSMILLVVLAFIAIATVTIIQYQEQSKQYHNDRLLRKERQIHSQIQYALLQTTFPINSHYLPFIFQEEIFHIANIQNTNFDIYGLDGHLLKSSRILFNRNYTEEQIPKKILTSLEKTTDKRYVFENNINGQGFLSSYSYITDERFKPIAILYIPYFENDPFYDTALKNSLYNLATVYLLLLIITIAVAYIISKYITKSLKSIEKKLEQTQLLKRNEKILLKNPSDEIGRLVCSYNSMIDEIEKSKQQLAKNERENAWKEMARQVAHEIKNPLTPMRLSIQSYQRYFPTENDTLYQENKTFCQTLLQQIDTLSNIASAFSTFASMPVAQKEHIEIVHIIRRTLELYKQPFIKFSHTSEEIYAFLDKDQLIRIVTNLITNALQATAQTPLPCITVLADCNEKEIILKVKDNGIGIEKTHQEKIFEPKFTTKSSGSGLGLSMVKNMVQAHKGNIYLYSDVGQGAEFIIVFPKSDT